MSMLLHISAYTKLVNVLESLECPHCYGRGYLYDAKPGDISYNTFICKDCKDTGFIEGKTYGVVEVPK